MKQLATMRFPEKAELGDDLDIIVDRKGSIANLTNRTAKSYQGKFLWLNRAYVTLIKRIDIGPDNPYELAHFINEHGESFPTARLLAPDRARPLVSADLIDPDSGQRHRLVVRLADN